MKIEYFGLNSLKALVNILKGYAKKTDNVASATKLQTPRTIDGVEFDGATDITHFGIPSTSGSTALTSIKLLGEGTMKLTTGTQVTLCFPEGLNSSTLNIQFPGIPPTAVYYRNSTQMPPYTTPYTLIQVVYLNEYDISGVVTGWHILNIMY